MKKTIFLFGFCGCFAVFSLTSCLILTNCKSKDEIPKDISQFIDNRTFSISAIKGSQWTRGTGWIINKQSDNTNEYKYWIATNWHVVLNNESSVWGYSDEYELKRTGSYKNFTSFTLLDPLMFTYDGNPLNAIDFYICDVDFGVNLESHFKNKLDNLNDFYKTHDGHINVFPKITKTPSELPCYIGGYPVQNRATWETHTINQCQFKAKNTYPHFIDGSGQCYRDTSPQLFLTPATENWMKAGASGSMVVNAKEEICGIYWGGFLMETSSNNDFLPCASIFNSSVKNFIPAEMI